MSEENSVNFVTKISANKIGFPKEIIRTMVPKPGDATPLFTAYGKLEDLKTGQDDKGNPWTKFLGMVEAVNMDTGEVFRSGAIFFPNSISSSIEGGLKKAKEDKDFSSLEFAVEVGAKFSEASIGYEFLVKSLIQPKKESDPLAIMRGQFSGKKLPKAKAK